MEGPKSWGAQAMEAFKRVQGQEYRDTQASIHNLAFTLNLRVVKLMSSS
jgi:hypothetical protein